MLEVLSTVQRRAMLHTLELKVGLKKHRFKGNTKRLISIFNYLPVVSISAGGPWHFGADPYLWLTDPDPTLRMQNKLLFFYLPAGTLSTVFNLLLIDKFCVKILFCNIILIRSTPLWEKGRVPVTNGSGSGRPKNMWIRTPTLVSSQIQRRLLYIKIGLFS